MRRGIAKYTAFCLAAGLTLTESGAVAMAAGTEKTLVGIKDTDFTGVKTSEDVEASGETDTSDETEPSEEPETTVAADSAALGEAGEQASETDTQETGAEEAVETDAQETPSAQADADDGEEADASYTDTDSADTGSTDSTDSADTQAVADTDMIGTTGFAVCADTVNVRSGADTDSSVVGSLRNHAAVEILDADEYGWYKIRSGNVTGYVAGMYIATGNDADQIAQTAGYTTAEVGDGIEALNVRAGASTDSGVVGTVSGSDQIEVVEDQGDWVKVVLDDGTYGYVSSDYVYTSTEYASAETIEEEQARLDAQWLDYLQSQGSSASYDEASAPTISSSLDADESSSYTDSSYTEGYTDTASDVSYDSSYSDSGVSDVQSSADAASSAYATYVEAQNAADAAVANGADSDTIYATAAAAQDAYASYLTAQNAADAAAAGSTADTSADSGTSDYTADTSYTTDTSAASYTETTDTSYSGSTDAQSAADAASTAYASYVEAQNAADAAVANGADSDTIYATAAAAQDAYASYLSAQNAADAAAAGSTADTSYTGDSSSTEEASYTEDTSYTAAEDISYTEDTSYTEEDSSQSTDPAADSGSSTGAAIASYACQFVGNPYVYGGSSLTSGADCSGFVMAVYAAFGISLPHEAAAQSAYGTSVSMDDLQPGDLLFYEGDGGIGHVTMYIGNGQVVHASNPSNGICISSVGYRTPCMAKRLV